MMAGWNGRSRPVDRFVPLGQRLVKKVQEVLIILTLLGVGFLFAYMMLVSLGLVR